MVEHEIKKQTVVQKNWDANCQKEFKLIEDSMS